MTNTAEQEVDTTGEQEVILFDKNNIVVFDKFRGELEELKAKSNSLVFDWTDPKQNKEGRSHIAKLRKSKTKVDELRKDAGRDALEFKNEVNKQGNELITEVVGIIEVHSKPLQEYEEKQQLRKDVHERNMQVFTNYKSVFESSTEVDSVEIKALIKILMDLDIGETWEEYKEPARLAREAAFKDLKPRLEQRLKLEEERADHARLQTENATRIANEEIQRKADKKKLDDENEAKEAAATKEREEQEEIDAANTLRVNAHQEKLDGFSIWKTYPIDSSPLAFFEGALESHIGSEIIEADWEEFADKAKLARLEAIKGWTGLIEAKKTRIEEQGRLQKLEDEKKEQERKDQEEADAQAERDRLAADETHREEIRESIFKVLEQAPLRMNKQDVDQLILLIENGCIPNVTLTY